ncbi:MAG: tryptophan--tRNA ligase [Burkholderiaceae bacterium]|nr:MAG: tryptophan--tRNA ligase [Burkholderiaceae bacterium]
MEDFTASPHLQPRVVSGMRPTGALHLGHYHGALKNWVKLQHEYESYFFVADWHALTTHYQHREVIERNVYDMVIDWLAAGLDPDRCTLFIQSRMPEHAELFTLLSMSTPLSWLERVPTYKDQLDEHPEGDLTTYGFLGYPLLQAADILIYKASYVPVGEDQAPHVEITREVARRFNHLYGREADFENKVKHCLAKLSPDDQARFEQDRKRYAETGEAEALSRLGQLVAESGTYAHWTRAEVEILQGHAKGTGKAVLREPQVLLTEASRVPGLDGRKMSKSYGNTIAMREEPEAVAQKIRKMPTDPQRVRLSDPGEPTRCPVWGFHQIYSSTETCAQLAEGCRSARIGCLDCKQPVIEAIQKEQAPWRERAAAIMDNPRQLHWLVEIGTERARTLAKQTMKDVRQAMGLSA